MIGSSADVPGTHMRSTLVLLLAALLAGCAAAPPALPAPGDDRVRRFTAEVSGAGALPHLQALQRIADANGGNRAAPGPGYDASVDYVAGVLRDAGYDVSTPTYRSAWVGVGTTGRRSSSGR